MTYIIRTQLRTTKGPVTRYGTVDPDGLTVRYREKHRKTGRIPGLGNIVEHAGWDKSTVSLKLTRDNSTSQGGTPGAQVGGWLTFRLLDRNKHVRHLQQDDEQVLAAIDAEIAQKLAELEAIRQRRKDAVAAAWRRAGELIISELEEKANNG